MQQNNEFPQFVVGGRTGDSFGLLKKSNDYVYSVWRSQVFQIGKQFEILQIGIVVAGGLSGAKEIIPTLYFDNEHRSSVGTAMNTANYPDGDKLVVLSAKNFANGVRGNSNFFFQLQFTGSDLAVVKMPLTIQLEIHDT